MRPCRAGVGGPPCTRVAVSQEPRGASSASFQLFLPRGSVLPAASQVQVSAQAAEPREASESPGLSPFFLGTSMSVNQQCGKWGFRSIKEGSTRAKQNGGAGRSRQCQRETGASQAPPLTNAREADSQDTGTGQG